ncbi:putative PSD protein [Hordeum vulgare]|nr:putative PSD protein [Hordeum vulgare]
MKNLKDANTKSFPSKTRGGKELPSGSDLDSPYVISKLATPQHAIIFDMSQVIDDATSAMNTSHDDASTLLNNDVPLGEFLDEQIASVRQHDTIEYDDELETENLETPTRTSPPRYEFPKVPEGYTMSDEATTDILACKDRDDLEKLLCKCKEKSLNAKMKCDPEFATSLIFIDHKDYEFSVDTELITLVESDPFHGYKTETVVGHLTKWNDIATLFAHDEKFAITIFSSYFRSH